VMGSIRIAGPELMAIEALMRSDKILDHFPSWIDHSRLTIGLPRLWMQSTPYYDKPSLTSSL
jgi:hypothetical protein